MPYKPKRKWVVFIGVLYSAWLLWVQLADWFDKGSAMVNLAQLLPFALRFLVHPLSGVVVLVGVALWIDIVDGGPIYRRLHAMAKKPQVLPDTNAPILYDAPAHALSARRAIRRNHNRLQKVCDLHL
jgi:hypothetical protein